MLRPALVFLLAGCIQATPMPAAADDLAAPRWEVGDSWHYVDSKAQWLNITVEALEERAGYATYRVRQHYAIHDYRPYEVWVWLDQATLGKVEWGRTDEAGAEGLRDSPPSGQIFPMENRTYTSYPNDDLREPMNLTLRIKGWDRIETPAGTFEAIEVQTTNSEGWVMGHGWYSPQVGNYARHGDHRLAYWSGAR